MFNKQRRLKKNLYISVEKFINKEEKKLKTEKEKNHRVEIKSDCL